MSLICLNCGNRDFFETDTETLVELDTQQRFVMFERAKLDDWNYADDAIRDQVRDNVLATMKMHADELRKDYSFSDPHNSYLQCAVCHSGQVCRPFSDWQPPKPSITLDDEILQNRNILTKLLKARKQYDNHLPVLWKPAQFPDSPLGTHDF